MAACRNCNNRLDDVSEKYENLRNRPDASPWYDNVPTLVCGIIAMFTSAVEATIVATAMPRIFADFRSII
jgi:hypothetical protein